MNTAPAYRIDGADSQRAAFYATACDPRQSIVVEACAGAGKTWMLVSRILRALLDGAEPAQILAITFTRKAAGEMRARLNEWLAEFAAPRASHAQRVAALRERGMNEADAQALAPALGGLYERVLASGRPVQIRTFHAWFSQLMRLAPLDVLAGMGLQPGMALIEDVEALRPELFRRFHRRVAADATLKAGYHALVARQGRSVIGRWLDQAWLRRIEIELADKAEKLDDGIPPAAALFPDCAGLAHPLELLRRDDVIGTATELVRQFAASKSAKCHEAAQRLHEALALAQAGDDSAGEGGITQLSAAFALAFKALHTDKGELRKLPGQWPDAEWLADRLQAIDQRVRQHEAHEDHHRMAALARVLLVEFAAVKRARGLVDMSDLECVALKLLGDSAWSGWIQERLDAQLRHLLIDEFQDTSPLQWHALQPWLAAYAGAGGGASGQQALSVFIVGDPKQSIYRFRRAEPRVFAAASDFVATALNGRRLACDHTRRNAPSVLAALNTVFSQAQDAGAYEGFRHHTTEVSAPGDGLWALPRDPKPPAASRSAKDTALHWRDSLTEPRSTEQERRGAQEARHVARAIAELLACGRVRPGQIQVLARRRSVLAQLSDALRALQVPHVRPDDLALADEPEARDLIALLDALASPGHDLSLAHALRSPVFGASDDDLLALAEAAGGRGWWRALNSLVQQGGASPALQRAAGLLAGWADAARLLPPHDLLDRILHEGDVIARTLQAVPLERRPHARAVIGGLLAQTLALDGGRYATPYGFVRALRSRDLKAGTVADAQAVQLLTVHGAKGLEAEVVFLMDCDPELRNPSSGSLLVDWPVESAHPASVAFVGRAARGASSLQSLQDQEALMEAREALNGLYVAMTRARQRLVLSSIAPRRKGAPIAWWDRLAPLAQSWVPETAVAGVAAADAPVEVEDWAAMAERLPKATATVGGIAADWVAPARGDQRVTLVGEAFHRLMQWACGPDGPAGSSDPDSRAAWLDDAAPAAAAEFDLQADEADQARRAAAAVLASPVFARFGRHGADLLWAGDEVPVTIDGEVLRIDRLVALNEGGQRTWWVLDYKLDRRPQDNADDLAQLARYRAAVERLQPGEPVHGAFVNGRGELAVQ